MLAVCVVGSILDGRAPRTGIGKETVDARGVLSNAETEIYAIFAELIVESGSMVDSAVTAAYIEWTERDPPAAFTRRHLLHLATLPTSLLRTRFIGNDAACFGGGG